jgi:hypothetical protein
MAKIIAAALLLAAAGCALVCERPPPQAACAEWDCKYDKAGNAHDCACYE